jgi:hypothetical protein
MMVLDTGLGFRSAVWHQIAQLLCRLDEVYLCDGCSRPYQRGIRKPRPGQDNFCPDCRKGQQSSQAAVGGAKPRDDEAPDGGWEGPAAGREWLAVLAGGVVMG